MAKLQQMLLAIHFITSFAGEVGTDAVQRVTIVQADLGMGLACNDKASGTGFLMYSAAVVQSRFASDPPYRWGAQHFLCVQHDVSQGWQYDTNRAWVGFSAENTDILVASVDFDADSVSDLRGFHDIYFNIARGYASGDLTFIANWWNGFSNPGEFTVAGTGFTPQAPTAAPTTKPPTAAPTTEAPTVAPTTKAPTAAPTTEAPTAAPTTKAPTAAPTTEAPTAAPTTEAPTSAPTAKKLCKAWCRRNRRSWTKKCGWKDCNGCSSCDERKTCATQCSEFRNGATGAESFLCVGARESHVSPCYPTNNGRCNADSRRCAKTGKGGRKKSKGGGRHAGTDGDAALIFGIIGGCVVLILVAGCVFANQRKKKHDASNQVLPPHERDPDDLERANSQTQPAPALEIAEHPIPVIAVIADALEQDPIRVEQTQTSLL